MFHPFSPAAHNYTNCSITTAASAALFPGEVIIVSASWGLPGIVTGDWRSPLIFMTPHPSPP